MWFSPVLVKGPGYGSNVCYMRIDYYGMACIKANYDATLPYTA